MPGAPSSIKVAHKFLGRGKNLDDLHHHKPASLQINFARDSRSPIPVYVDTGATLIDKSNVNAFIQAESEVQR